MSTPHQAIFLTVEQAGWYNGYNVKIGGQQAYYRPYDGSDWDDVVDEACKALGELLREKLGHPAEEPEDRGEW